MTVPTLPATTPADEAAAAALPSLRASESAGGALLGRLRRGGPFGAIWIATVVLFALSPLLASGSVSRSALLSMLPFAAILAIAALGQTLVVQQGGLDLSVPGTIALAGALTTKLAGGGTSLLLTLLVIAAVAIATGLLIGFAITRLGITPLVATLGSNALLLGVVLQVTGGSITNTAPQSLTDFAQGKSLGIPHTALIALALVAVVAVLTRKTVWGRRFEAVGANPRAARAAGINVTGYQVGAYVGAALCYAAAGVLLAGFISAPSLFSGDDYLLPTIAAVVLGGTSLAGGRGSVVATAVGALFLTQLEQVVLAMGAENAVQLLIQGAIVAFGMGLRNVPWRRIAGRRRQPPAPSH
ncbi:MAG TPA: ABC transporter permease [Conexibacter sp.]|nr:ABC transporter permease [Conexibacter sp.]